MSVFIADLKRGDLGHTRDKVKNKLTKTDAGTTRELSACISRKLTKYQPTETALCAKKAADNWQGDPVQGDYAHYLTQGWRMSTLTHKRENGGWVVRGDIEWVNNNNITSPNCGTMEKMIEKRVECWVNGSTANDAKTGFTDRQAYISQFLASNSGLTEEEKAATVYSVAERAAYRKFESLTNPNKDWTKDDGSYCWDKFLVPVEDPTDSSSCDSLLSPGMTTCSAGKLACWAPTDYNSEPNGWTACIAGTDCSV